MRTKTILANTAGTLPIRSRAGIGKGREVMSMAIVVTCVPILRPNIHEQAVLYDPTADDAK